MNPPLRAFISTLDNQYIPNTTEDALRNPKWKDAVNDEIRALIKNDTWDLVSYEPGIKLVGCKWVFSIKYNTNRTINRYKVRLGTTMEYLHYINNSPMNFYNYQVE